MKHVIIFARLTNFQRSKRNYLWLLYFGFEATVVSICMYCSRTLFWVRIEVRSPFSVRKTFISLFDYIERA